MNYLVRWDPYSVVMEVEEGVQVDIPPGHDLLSSLPVPVFNKSDKWDFSIVPVKEVLFLWETRDFRSIYKLHNESKWSDLHYCCDFHKTIVERNVLELRKIAKVDD